MQQSYLRKWQDLLGTLGVTGGNSLPTEEEIRSFEETTKIALPIGFKEYCSVFGSGVLAGEFTVYCPCPLNRKFDLLSNCNFNLNSYKDAVKFEIEHGFLEAKRMR
jgi:hypothetical protein